MPEALPLLPLLVEWAAFFLALACCVLASYIVWALFGAAEKGVGWIPWAGKWLKGSLHTIEQRISNKLGQAVAALDHRMALTFYKMAHLVAWVGNEIKANAGLLAALANLIANPNSIAAWRAAINGAHTAIQGVESSIGGTVHGLTRPVTARIARLEHRTHLWYLALHFAIAVTIPGELLNLRHRNRSLTDSLTNAWKLLKKHERLLGLASMTGIVAVVLSRLGLGWTRCSNVGKLGKSVCGINPNLLESLLAGALVVASPISVVDLARACQVFTSECEDGVKWFVRELK